MTEPSSKDLPASSGATEPGPTQDGLSPRTPGDDMLPYLSFIALGGALLALILLFSRGHIGDITRKGPQAEEEKVKVLVAKQNLQIHQLLKEPENLFEEKEYPKSLEPKKAIKEFSELVGQRLNKPIREGDHVTKEDLLDKTKDPFANMPKGYRAFAIKTILDSAVAGFVQPQSRVDIIAVIRSGQNQEVTSRTILQKVLVLAVDQTPVRAENKVATVPSTVTVQVTDRDAQKLALASDLGQLKLSLRSSDDKTVAGAEDASAIAIISGLARAREAIVTIKVEKGVGNSPALGTGAIIDDRGYVLANHHQVVNAERMSITLRDGTVLKCKVAFADPGHDLTILRLEPGSKPFKLDPLQLSPTTVLKVGERLIGGYPLGSGILVSAGTITGLGVQIQLPGGGKLTSLIQTTVAGPPGTPLFDVNGSCIGIIVAVAQDGAQRITYANNTEIIKEALKEAGLVERQSPTKPEGFLPLPQEDSLEERLRHRRDPFLDPAPEKSTRALSDGICLLMPRVRMAGFGKSYKCNSKSWPVPPRAPESCAPHRRSGPCRCARPEAGFA